MLIPRLACRERHVKCDENFPKCAQCDQLNRICIWTPLSARNRNCMGDVNYTQGSLGFTSFQATNFAGESYDRSGRDRVNGYGAVGVTSGDSVGGSNSGGVGGRYTTSSTYNLHQQGATPILMHPDCHDIDASISYSCTTSSESPTQVRPYPPNFNDDTLAS